MNEDELTALSGKIIGCVYTVSNTLGVGFLEMVYENALGRELRKAGLNVRQQHNIPVSYDGVIVGAYEADLVVEDSIILELKSARALDEVHTAQCINYLRATGMQLCLLINFGTPKVQIKRFRGKGKDALPSAEAVSTTS